MYLYVCSGLESSVSHVEPEASILWLPQKGLSHLRCHGEKKPTAICYLLQREPEFFLTEQMDLSCARGGGQKEFSLHPRPCSPGLSAAAA